MPGKVRVTTNPVANTYANERIIEFSAGTDGAGGLISFVLKDDGSIHVHVYRQERTVVTHAGMTRAERTAAQVAHIREHEERFHATLSDGDVAEYFAAIGGWDLYERVCADLRITPRPEICHPNPEA